LVDGVTVSHSGVPVICDITLSVDNDELVVIIGPSGSGESNLLRAIAGSTASAMEILFDDQDVRRHPPNEPHRSA
jgi:ABC-type sugar transport system ATPase subunit